MKVSKIKIRLFYLLAILFGRERVGAWYKKRCLKIYEAYQCIFIHIPKAGGSTIAFQLFGKRAGHYSAEEIRDAMGNEKFKSLYSFAVVRNPYQRIVSAYQFLKNGGGSEGAVFMRPEYASAAFASFDSFVRDWLVHQDPNQVDILFRPQHKFVCDRDGNLLVEWVGQIENFLEISNQLKAQIGFELKNQKRNITPKMEPVQIGPDISRLLYDFYQKDFEMFNYPPNFIG